MTFPKLPFPTTFNRSKSSIVKGISWLRLYSTPSLTLPVELLKATQSVPLNPGAGGSRLFFDDGGAGSSNLGFTRQLPRKRSSSRPPEPGLRIYMPRLSSVSRLTSNLYWVLYPENIGESRVPEFALTMTWVLSNSMTQ